MFVFDQLKRNDHQLQVFSLVVITGMLILLSGLWYVQVVSAKRYEKSQIKQSIRSVRVPGIRGKILDRNGVALAENRASYNVDVYLEELLAPFEMTNSVLRDYRKEFGSRMSSTQLLANVKAVKQQARFQIISNLAASTAGVLKAAPALKPDDFFRHLEEWKYVPYPLFKRLQTAPVNQLALFSEQLAGEPSMDLDMQAMRYYPYNQCAAHLLGYVRSKKSDDDENISFCLPFWTGLAGVERAFEMYLEGSPGVRRVVVDRNNFRQREESVSPEPGDDIYLTLDVNIQVATEAALASAMPNTRGAAVVMDVHNGDILALASTPTYNPNLWTSSLTPEDNRRLFDPTQRPMFNRAVAGAYHPGSIFKIITSIAILESGIDTSEVYTSLGYYPLNDRGAKIGCTAGPGNFNFERAFYKSSNAYFCYYGTKVGAKKILEVAQRFHLGESTELGVGSEASGFVPKPENARNLPRSDTPYMSIGQVLTTTPLQMAGVISVIANGGTLYWPRVVSHRVSSETGEVEVLAPAGRERCKVPLNPQHLDIIRHAMVQDTEHPEGTAYKTFNSPRSTILTQAGFRIAGKTGTAQRIEHGVKDHVVWFASYGPFNSPRYAVIVMVESGVSGGTTCAPVARRIYEALVQNEQAAIKKAVAKN
jgi:penicillin-binding protein 2